MSLRRSNEVNLQMRWLKRKIKVSEDGLVLFKSVMQAMRAEKVLQNADYPIRMVAPPPNIRSGCDLAVGFNLLDRTGVERVLQQHGIKPLDIIFTDNVEMRPSELTKEIHFGKYVMVKAGNVKLTFEKISGVIVNISGGGCPDIPFLNLTLLHKNLTETPKPRDVGYTLCAYMLDKAYERALTIFRG